MVVHSLVVAVAGVDCSRFEDPLKMTHVSIWDGLQPEDDLEIHDDQERIGMPLMSWDAASAARASLKEMLSINPASAQLTAL